MAGAYYDSEEEELSRASMDTAAWGRRIMGLQQAATAKRHTKNETRRRDLHDSESVAAADDVNSNAGTELPKGVPPPPADTVSDAGAATA